MSILKNIIKPKRENDIVCKNEIQTLEVRDLKEYLVRDFQQIEADAIEIKNLKNRIEELEKTEALYKATLVTLEEFDTRVEREKQNVRELEDKLSRKNEEIKQLNEKINNHIILEKKLNDKCENLRPNVVDELKVNLKNLIMGKKGTLSKKTVCQIIDKVE